MSGLAERIAGGRAAIAAQPPGAVPQIAGPIVVDDNGHVWLEEGHQIVGRFLHAGIRLRWAPLPELGGLMLDQLGGMAAADGYEEEGILAYMTRDGLAALIADLQAIHDAAGAS